MASLLLTNRPTDLLNEAGKIQFAQNIAINGQIRDEWFSLFWPIVGLSLSLTTAHFEEERPPLALATGKVINSQSAISPNGNTCAFRFSDILPLCCRADVTYSFTTKLTLWTWSHDMAHTSTQSAASLFNGSCYWPIGVKSFFILSQIENSLAHPGPLAHLGP